MHQVKIKTNISTDGLCRCLSNQENRTIELIKERINISLNEIKAYFVVIFLRRKYYIISDKTASTAPSPILFQFDSAFAIEFLTHHEDSPS